MKRAYLFGFIALLLSASVIAITYSTKSQTYLTPITTNSTAYIDSVTSPNQTWLDFDGVNDNIYYDNIILNLSNGLTVSNWAKYYTNSTVGMSMIEIKNFTGTTVFYSYVRDVSGVNQYKPRLIYNTTCDKESATTGFAKNDSTWHMFTFVFNGTNINAYVDGVYNATNSAYSTSCISAISNMGSRLIKLSIGSDSAGTSRLFNGSIDKVYINNRVLSNLEINKLYELTRENYEI